jgi:hypothetical protein
VYMALYPFNAEGTFMETCKKPFQPGETMTGSVTDPHHQNLTIITQR